MRMDAQPRTRSVERDAPEQSSQRQRGSHQIVISMTQSEYDQIWRDPQAVRKRLLELVEVAPESFPQGFKDGFALDGLLRESKKLPGVRLRKIILNNGSIYELRPSFVMSYMMGTVDELENPLLMLSMGNPCWLVTKIFGHNDMYWQRLVERMGRNSLVGATVRDPLKLPQHLAADEHHCDWAGEKGFIATTAGAGCLLGISLTKSADEEHLTKAYQPFADEARQVSPDYSPESVNTDGWAATQNAFKTLFEGITVILCFLHGFLKIRDRCRKNFEVGKHVWDVYRAATASEFRDRMQSLKQWCESQELPDIVKTMVNKLIRRTDEYAKAYEKPGCHRTSNMVDRLMNRLYRVLYAGRGLHGNQASSERRLRGWALLLNYRPFAPRSGLKREFHCPADRLNGRSYHENWLHNMNIATSLMGYRAPAPANR